MKLLELVTLSCLIPAILYLPCQARRLGQKAKPKESPFRVIDSTAIDEKPQMIVDGKLVYPDLAKIGVGGVVDIVSRIDTTGNIDNAKIYKSSGIWALDSAAQNTAKLCKYRPAIKDGKPVSCWIIRTYRFNRD